MSLKALSSLHLITGSADSTPATGFGSVYASGSSLYFKNSSGTEFDLTKGRTNIIYYNIPGPYTYFPPSNLTELFVVCVGAGAGGASGRKGVAGAASGGGGGGGGQISFRKFLASELTSGFYVITVGASGSGGAAVSTNDTNGIPGTAGGISSFSSLVVAQGGLSSSVPTSTSAQGALGNSLSLRAPFSYAGGPGGAGCIVAGTVGGSPTAGMSTFYGPPGGAGGGKAGSTGTAGGASSILNNINATITAGSNGLSNVNTLLLFSTSSLSLYGIGVGGGGGVGGNTAVSPTSGNNGGNGGNYGAGGGGGGGAINGISNTSGAGGNGGDGLVILMEYY